MFSIKGSVAFLLFPELCLGCGLCRRLVKPRRRPPRTSTAPGGPIAVDAERILDTRRRRQVPYCLESANMQKPGKSVVRLRQRLNTAWRAFATERARFACHMVFRP
jgi:hypothetical protein